MARTLKIGFKIAPVRVSWAEFRTMWQRAGELRAFESAWMFDHLYPVDGDGSCFEVMTALAALTPLVPGHQVGHLVLANPYRHPALGAKSAATIDHISGGNFVLGLGAGWHIPETTAYGITLDPVGQRLRDLDLRTWSSGSCSSPRLAHGRPTAASHRARAACPSNAPPYRLTHARNDPLPLRGERMPIWLGVQGERVGLRMVAELADGWNFSGAHPFEEFGPRLDVLRRHADDVGRDMAETYSAQMHVHRHILPEARERAFAFAAAGVQHLILYLDGRQGPGMVDLAATEIVAPLRDAFS